MEALLGRRTAIVIGAAETGSAVAVRLHEAGFAVVVCDEVDPPGIRRGMSFIDAWYIGTASLADVRATFCGSIRSIPTILALRRSVAATTWSWRGVAAHLGLAVIVDAREGTGDALDLLHAAPPEALTIGIGSAYRAGHNARIALAPASEAGEAAVGADTSGGGGPGKRNHCLLFARAGGRFHTARHIGERVEAGEPVGGVGARSIEAPASGVLSGLAARGSRVAAGAPILEVDTCGDPVRCFLIPESCDAVAREVIGHATEVDQALGVPHIGAFQAADRGSASSAPRGPRMTVA